MPDAIFQQVVEGVGKRIQTAVASDNTINVYRRRKPVLLDSDTIPAVIVSPASDGERIIFETFGGSVVYGYPVTCLIVSKGNTIITGALEAEGSEPDDTDADVATDTHMSLRETVRTAVYKRTVDDVASVFNGEIMMAPAATIVNGSGSLYLVSAVTVTHWSLETHTW